MVRGERCRAGFMRWGVISHRAKDPKIGSGMINSRVGMVAEEPAFLFAALAAEVPRARGRHLRLTKVRPHPETHAIRHEIGGALRLRRAVVSVEGPERQSSPLMRHHHNRGK